MAQAATPLRAAHPPSAPHPALTSHSPREPQTSLATAQTGARGAIVCPIRRRAAEFPPPRSRPATPALSVRPASLGRPASLLQRRAARHPTQPSGVILASWASWALMGLWVPTTRWRHLGGQDTPNGAIGRAARRQGCGPQGVVRGPGVRCPRRSMALRKACCSVGGELVQDAGDGLGRAVEPLADQGGLGRDDLDDRAAAVGRVGVPLDEASAVQVGQYAADGGQGQAEPGGQLADGQRARRGAAPARRCAAG